MFNTSKIAVLTILFLCFAQTAFAQQSIGDPVLTSAKFDANGKLLVKVKEFSPLQCYITVVGGLSRNKIDTPIISRQVTNKDAQSDVLSIRTARRYYCKKRKLYVQIEKVCLGDLVGQTLSEVKVVDVPVGNVRS